MKYVLVIVVLFCWVGCRKESFFPTATAGADQRVLPVRPGPPVQLPATCINSYAQLYRLVGRTVLAVRSVVLADGTSITVSGPVQSMVYQFYFTGEPNSLFRSSLQVLHTTNGYLQSYVNDSWSAGCVYPLSALPVHTNLVSGLSVYVINAGITWGIGVHAGKVVRYVVLQ
jgi:hypothetical protein